MRKMRFEPSRCALWLACVWSLCALSQGAMARSLAEIVQSKQLRACIAPVHPAVAQVEPTACQENCQFKGPAVEEVLAFAASLGQGVKAKMRRIQWDEQFSNQQGQTVREASYTPHLLASGQCDLFPVHLTKTAWREKKMDFVVLFPNRMMVIVQKSNKARFRKVADLAGKNGAIEKNTSYHTWLDQQNLGQLAANPTRLQFMLTPETIRAVEQGQVDFTLADANMAIWATRQLKQITVAFPVGDSDEVGWAFRKQDKDLQAAVQQFFDAQRKQPDSAFNAIWRKNFGRSLTEFIELMAAIR